METKLIETDINRVDEQIEQYIRRDKFAETDFYPGLAMEELRAPLNNLMNLVAQEFQQVAHNQPTAEKYRSVIKSTLEQLPPIHLDSEEQDQICTSFEELMDIVGLESSGGLLNKWRYGFDPTVFIK